MYSTRYSCQILMEGEFPRLTLEKNNQVTIFLRICSVGAQLFSENGRADKQTE